MVNSQTIPYKCKLNRVGNDTLRRTLLHEMYTTNFKNPTYLAP